MNARIRRVIPPPAGALIAQCTSFQPTEPRNRKPTMGAWATAHAG